MQLPRGKEVKPERFEYQLKGFAGNFAACSFQEMVIFMITYMDSRDILILDGEYKGEWMMFEGRYRRIADAP